MACSVALLKPPSRSSARAESMILRCVVSTRSVCGVRARRCVADVVMFWAPEGKKIIVDCFCLLRAFNRCRSAAWRAGMGRSPSLLLLFGLVHRDKLQEIIIYCFL